MGAEITLAVGRHAQTTLNWFHWELTWENNEQALMFVELGARVQMHMRLEV